jgi:hypothetical protein
LISLQNARSDERPPLGPEGVKKFRTTPSPALVNAYHPNYASNNTIDAEDPRSVGCNPSPGLMNAYQAFIPLPMGEGVINYSLLFPRPHRGRIGGEGPGVRGRVQSFRYLIFSHLPLAGDTQLGTVERNENDIFLHHHLNSRFQLQFPPGYSHRDVFRIFL